MTGKPYFRGVKEVTEEVTKVTKSYQKLLKVTKLVTNKIKY